VREEGDKGEGRREKEIREKGEGRRGEENVKS